MKRVRESVQRMSRNLPAMSYKASLLFKREAECSDIKYVEL